MKAKARNSKMKLLNVVKLRKCEKPSFRARLADKS